MATDFTIAARPTGHAKKLALIESMREAREADVTQLHTITLAVTRMRQMKAALQACETYFEERADAEYFTDAASPSGNEEMRLLVEVQAAISGLPQASA
jgi:hypothetical protein